MPKSIEKRAIDYVVKYLQKNGHQNIQDVQYDRKHNGYDIIATKKRKKIKIEVKGCTRPWGIPDPYITEFTKEKRLIADFMYVVYFIEKKRPQLCIIPRKAIKPELVKPKFGYRISSVFKRESVLKKYLQ